MMLTLVPSYPNLPAFSDPLPVAGTLALEILSTSVATALNVAEGKVDYMGKLKNLPNFRVASSPVTLF